MKVRNTLRFSNWRRSKISIPFGSRPIKNICPTGRHFIAIFICCSESIFIETIISEAALPEKLFLDNSWPGRNFRLGMSFCEYGPVNLHAF